jgi:uncharacterized protein (TIRG00374 family)
MSKRLKKILQFSFFFLLTAVLLWFSFKDVKFSELWEGIKNANYVWVIIGTLIGIFAYFVRAQRWRMLVKPLGYSPSLINTYDAVIIGYLGNLVFPRFGEIARCAALTRSNGVPFDKLVGTVVVERLFDLICMVFLLLFVFFVRLDTFGKFVTDNVSDAFGSINTAVVILIVVLILVLICLSIVLAWRFRGRIKSNALGQKVISFCKGIVEGFKTFAHMERRWWFVFHTMLLWVCYWLMAWLVLFAVPATSHLGPLDGLVVMLLGSLGIVTPTSGGLGAFHAIMKLGLPFLYKTSESDALLYATINHESQLLFIVILGLIAYAKVFIFPKHKASC